ncbi:MAG: glycosyltransferase family 39 protein [Acidobacteria bacterium]|nr:glycosyltransferase family 39 protein [Acidobacteriota bacterium]
MMTRLSAAPLIVAALALAGLTIRLQHLEQPLLGFHPTRQYRSAVIARACYFDHAQVPEWARATARANLAMQPAGEPPFMEWLACGAYQALGAERLEAARVLGSTFWVIGTIPLYALITSIASPAAAIVGISTYLFAPYGIVASRAFQPDALMTLCALCALWALVRFHARPTTSRLAAAAVAVGIATVVKPMSVFLTIPVAVGCAAAQGGLVRALRSPALWRPAALGLIPGVVYYGYSAIAGTLARDQMQLRFVPSLLGTTFFWQGLWTQLGHVFGVLLLTVMVLGTCVAPRGLARALLVSLWTGYAAFAVAFTYHMPTHDYYHLPYLTLAALAVASVFEFGIRPRLRGPAMRIAVIGACLIGAAGIAGAMPAIRTGDAERLEQYEKIGELADHSARVLFLDLHYGYPLMYHGQLAGDAWPTTDDLTAEQFGGAPEIDAQVRYARDFADYRATHFIVTDVASLQAQADLEQLLGQIATVVTQTPAYHVYRLTGASR